MSTPTPSPARTTPTRQREPLRWLAAAALLLAFLLICCVAEVTVRLLQPRNAASYLNLLSQDHADYGPWAALGLAAIPPELPAAQAADRATATMQAATGTPTPALVGSVPTAPVAVVPPAANFPTPTPADVFILEQPTATPRPVGIISTSVPVTVPPLPTNVPDTVPPPPTPTDTPAPTPTRTPQPDTGAQPTRTPVPTGTNVPATPTLRPTNTPVARTAEPTATAAPSNTPRPVDTNTPAPSNTPRPVDTNTPVPATDTPVPPTAAPPTSTPTNTPRPRPTSPPDTPTPTLAPTPTNTPVPPTNTPTITPLQADVAVDKTGPANVTLNLDATYVLTVSNNGPGAATNVVLTDTPGGVPWTLAPSSSDSICASNGVTITCNLGTLSAGASTTITLAIRPASIGTLTNVASVTATEADPLPANNTDQITTQIDPAATADVRVTKNGQSSASVSDSITYNVTVTNDGPSPATDVLVVDTPSGINWTFISGTFGTGTGACTLAGAEIRCPMGTIPAGASVNITMVIQADSGGTLRNRADVSAAETDPDTSNNTSEVTTDVAAASIPGVSLDISATTANGDGTAQNNITDVTYIITIANTTGSDLTVSRFENTFSTFEVRGCPVLPPGSSCSPAPIQPGLFRWNGPVSVPDGESITFHIVGRFVSAPVGSECFPSHTLTTSAGVLQRPRGEPCVNVTP